MGVYEPRLRLGPQTRKKKNFANICCAILTQQLVNNRYIISDT